MGTGAVSFATTFLASAVEAVEALTIVLAVGVTRGWRSTLLGVGAALLVLAAIVAALGPALTRSRSTTLRLVVGALLLVFGLQWLRKAILRASGYKALHDEGAAFAEEREQARRGGRGPARASTGTRSRSRSRACCSRGSRSPSSSSPSAPRRARLGLAAAAAPPRPSSWSSPSASLVRAPLARVPENAIKFAVGLMLTTFGMFWAARAPASSGRAATRRCSPCSHSWRSCPSG